MANVAGSDGRIDPRQIVATNVPETPVVLWILRLALGLVAASVVLIFTSASLKLWSIIPSVTVGALATWKANGRRMLQIGAEFLPGPSAPVSRRPRNTKPATAINVYAGDFACSAKEYGKLLAKHQGAQERTASGRVEAEQGGEGRQPAEEPAVPLKRVMVTAESPDNKRVALIFADGYRDEPARDEEYYVHRPKGKRVATQPIQEASGALSQLLASLAIGRVSESNLISELTSSYTEPVAHRALRAALSQRLVEGGTGLGRFFFEVCAVFSRRMDERLRRTRLGLSPVGTLWVGDSNALWHDKESNEEDRPKFTPGTVNVTLIMDSAGSVHRGTSSPSNDQSHGAEAQNQTTKTTDDSSGVGIAALSGTVAGAAAAIATLIYRGALWGRALFISFVFISLSTFMIAIFALVPVMVSWWRARHSTSPKGDISAGPDA